MKVKSSVAVLLSGEPNPIPSAELHALMEIYDPLHSLMEIEKRIFVGETEANIAEIALRSAFIRFAGKVILISPITTTEEDLARTNLKEILPDFSSFRVKLVNLTSKKSIVALESLIGRHVQSQLPSVQVTLTDPELIIVCLQLTNKIIISHAQVFPVKRKWIERRPKARSFFHPSALYPKFARSLVNISRVRNGEVLLDPFCGSGSILIEAVSMDINAIGLDISRNMCQGSLQNLRQLNPHGEIINADAKKVPLRCADGIATDAPYGRISSTKGLRVGRLIEDFLREAGSYLAKGRYCALVHPDNELFDPQSFVVVESHRIPVHRSLTRVVSVLQRS